ncbi:MAG: hypothetical protein Q8Q40_05590 [Methylococcaceae bacterium]|nr:hypothetical protein [Methylococcaceae bacterium]MDP3903428.1 hypothetical protein [Methylococcaceae bacterium]
MFKIIISYSSFLILFLVVKTGIADTTEFHGFQINSQLVSEQQKNNVLPSLGKQLDIVQSVGLPDAVVEFFKGIPILIDPGLTSMPGQYTKLNGQWLVRVSPVVFPENRPIVLH